MLRTTINVEELRKILDLGEQVTVLDIRRGRDRAESFIPGSVYVDAYDALRAGDPHALDDLGLPAGVPVVTVCAAGRTSEIAADRLRAQGFDALSLEGGMKAWSLAWNTADVPVAATGAEVVQVRRTGKGCLSYLIGSGGEAAVIDASVAPEVYDDLAGERGWRISHVLDTHVHADHLSRSGALVGLTGAKLLMPAGAPVSYPFSSLGDGDEIEIGGAKLRALWTPGHTAESTSYLLDEAALFTGDTLFLTTVGRPDLGASPKRTREKARSLYGSVRRLLELGPGILVLPGHTSEPVPFDGKPVAATLTEVRQNFRLPDEDAFVEKVSGRLAPTPENYERILELNRSGTQPEGDPAELEAGANRCAAS